MKQMDICQIDDDYEPDDPMSHQMMIRSSSDSGTELPVIHEENLKIYQSDMSIGMFHGEVHTSYNAQQTVFLL